MPQADTLDVHVNRILTMLSVGYEQPGFIADDIFPMVGVNKMSDIIPQYPQSPWFRDEGYRLVRAPGTAAAKTGLTVDTTMTYLCVNNAIGGDIPYEIADNQDEPFNMDDDVRRLCQSLLKLRRERSFGATYMTTGLWGDDDTGGVDFSKWSDYGSSSPLADMRGAQRFIRRKIGRAGNMWVWGDLVWQRLQDHPELIGRLPDNTLRMPTRAAIAALLEIPANRILVGESMFTSSAEGVAEASVTYADVFDDDALCLYVPDRPGLFEPTAGYTFFWKNSVAPMAPQFVRSYDDTKVKARTVEVHSYFHQKSIVINAGKFMSDAVD